MSTDTNPSPAAASNHANRYHQLDSTQHEIRVLIVKPGSHRDRIECSLTHVSLLQNPSPLYETISYVWGDEIVCESIYLCDQPTSVPASTEIVLRRVRHSDQQRVVWIDAVCINQNDADERGAQVALMSEIYGKTYRNLIWLGEGDSGTGEKAIDSISAILRDIKAETDDFCSFTKKIYATWGNFLFSDTTISVQVDWPALIDYFSSQWFTRLWIVQEASLPMQSICYRGRTVIPLESVLRVACWIIHKSVSLSSHDLNHFRGIKCALAIFMFADRHYGRYNIIHNRGGRAMTLSLLIGSLQDFDSRDPRDQMFGILGLY